MPHYLTKQAYQADLYDLHSLKIFVNLFYLVVIFLINLFNYIRL